MLIRLLLALLMLMGPIPVGSCTCQAADASKLKTTDESVPAPAAPSTHRCKHHHALSDSTPTISAAGSHRCELCFAHNHESDSDRHQHDHDRDCPAVSAGSIPQAVQNSASDLSLTIGLDLPVWTGVTVADSATSADRHLPRSATADIPLFLSLLSIRI